MERIVNGRILVETSGKYRTPAEILVTGEPNRLGVALNQLSEKRVTRELIPALAVAVVAGDFLTVDRADTLLAGFEGEIARLRVAIDEAVASVARPAVDIAEAS